MVSYNEHIIFTGDTIYLDAVPASSLPERDPDLYHKSERNSERFSSAALLFPGHGAYEKEKSNMSNIKYRGVEIIGLVSLFQMLKLKKKENLELTSSDR